MLSLFSTAVHSHQAAFHVAHRAMYAQVLACDATLGYEDLYNVQLKKFNGQPVVNLRHLISLVNESKQPYMRFDLEYDVRRAPWNHDMTA